MPKPPSFKLCMFFLSPADFYGKINFFENKSFGYTIRVSNSLDPVKARGFAGPDLGRNCLQRFAADAIGRQRVNKKAATLPDCFVVDIRCMQSLYERRQSANSAFCLYLRRILVLILHFDTIVG